MQETNYLSYIAFYKDVWYANINLINTPTLRSTHAWYRLIRPSQLTGTLDKSRLKVYSYCCKKKKRVKLWKIPVSAR